MTKYDLRAMSRATQSMRSGYRPLVEDEMVGISKTEQRKENEQRQTELDALAEIASLANHPGYQKIAELRKESIRQYRSGEFLTEAAKDPAITNEKLGELTRIGLLTAETLEREILTVEAAVNAVADEKQRERQHERTTSRQNAKGV